MKNINFINIKTSKTFILIISFLSLIVICIFISKIFNIREYLDETTSSPAELTGISSIPQSNALTSAELESAQSQNSVEISSFNQSMIASIGASEKSKILMEIYNSVNNHGELLSIYDSEFSSSKISIVPSNSIIDNLVAVIIVLNRHEREIIKLSDNTYYPCQRLNNIDLNELRALARAGPNNISESTSLYIVLEIIDYHDFIIQKISEKYASRISTAYYRIHS